MIGVCLASLAVLLCVWFAGWPRGLGVAPPLAILVAAVLASWWRRGRPVPRPGRDTLAVLAAATAYRLPALVYPWGFVNKDGFYGAMVALHVLHGTRPAPAFLEGLSYQGTIKAHLAALISFTGATDPSFLMAAASTLFCLAFVVVTMQLARHVAGRWAALAAGLYVAIGPKFLTTLSLNCQGQYVEILALGGGALALTAWLLAQDLVGRAAAGAYAGLGLLLGAAFWQQPVAVCYVVTAGLVLALRRRTWRDPWVLLVGAGLLVGVLPVLLWNVQHHWGTGEVVAANTTDLAGLLAGLPRHVRRTFRISMPILAGLSPGHPWSDVPGVGAIAASLPVALLAGHVAICRHGLLDSLRRLSPSPALLPPVLMLSSLAIFWAVPGELIHFRPRYILPVAAATAVHLGTVVAWLARRNRVAAVAATAALVALNAVGMVPRLAAARGIQDWYASVVRSLDEKGVRTGFADFSIAAPVTMFTAERIVLSPRLGPTPNFESRVHASIVDAAGADAYVLLPGEDAEPFAATLRRLGVGYRLDTEPVPVFYGLSRRVGIEEVAGFRAGQPPPRAGGGPPED